MKLISYAEALKLGKDKINEALIPIRVKRARTQAELEMLKLEEQVATKTAELHELCCEEKPSFPKIIEMQDDIALLERKLEQYEKILAEMFPEEKS